MTTIFLDEIETNATIAALIERSQRLGKAIGRLITQPQTDDQAFALACNRQALRHTELALHRIGGSLPEAEGPDAIDEYKAARDRGIGYHDHQAAGPVTEDELLRGYGIDNIEGQPEFNGSFR